MVFPSSCVSSRPLTPTVLRGVFVLRFLCVYFIVYLCLCPAPLLLFLWAPWMSVDFADVASSACCMCFPLLQPSARRETRSQICWLSLSG